MSSHVHLVAAAETRLLNHILRDFKSYTAKQLLQLITENPQESRKDWLLFLFRHFAKNKPNTQNQFWQHHNHLIDLTSNAFIEQKLEYIHQNPVKSGLVNEPHECFYSSANLLSPI